MNASEMKRHLEKQRERFCSYNMTFTEEIPGLEGEDKPSQHRYLSRREQEIIESYPARLHHLLKELVSIAHINPPHSSFSEEELSNFRHNMGHLFVSVCDDLAADLRTLWAEGWREQDIIRFMISKKVRYILCHDFRVIQCLNLGKEPSVYVFEKGTLI